MLTTVELLEFSVGNGSIFLEDGTEGVTEEDLFLICSTRVELISASGGVFRLEFGQIVFGQIVRVVTVSITVVSSGK